MGGVFDQFAAADHDADFIGLNPIKAGADIGRQRHDDAQLKMVTVKSLGNATGQTTRAQTGGGGSGS